MPSSARVWLLGLSWSWTWWFWWVSSTQNSLWLYDSMFHKMIPTMELVHTQKSPRMTKRPLPLSAWGQLTEYSFSVASSFSPVKGEIPACYETSAILSTFWNIQQHSEMFSCAERQVRSPHIFTGQINEPRWGIWWQKQNARVPLNKVTQCPSQAQEFINSLSRLSFKKA